MEAFLRDNYGALASVSFFGALAVVAVLETYFPKRTIGAAVWQRWAPNFGLEILNWIILYFAFPVAAYVFAEQCTTEGWGLFNQFETAPVIVAVTCVLAHDFAGYLRHAAFHYIPAFWRCHRLHHTDLEVDFSTSIRFHPLESLLTQPVTFAMIMLLGTPPHVIVILTVLLGVSGFFTHANIALPEAVDRFVRYWLITPDMHRIHHSAEPDETNSNFGVTFPWWDRLFGTYVASPRAGHHAMQLGLREFLDSKYQTFGWMLWIPFIRTADAPPSQVE